MFLDLVDVGSRIGKKVPSRGKKFLPLIYDEFLMKDDFTGSYLSWLCFWVEVERAKILKPHPGSSFYSQASMSSNFLHKIESTMSLRLPRKANSHPWSSTLSHFFTPSLNSSFFILAQLRGEQKSLYFKPSWNWSSFTTELSINSVDLT